MDSAETARSGGGARINIRVWIRKVSPAQQIAKFGLESNAEAYLVARIDASKATYNEQANSASRLFDIESIVDLIELCTTNSTSMTLFRGRASADWFWRFQERAFSIHDVSLSFIDNGARISFVCTGPTGWVQQLRGTELDPWQDYAFALADVAPAEGFINEALRCTDQRIWERLANSEISAECVPLFWEGTFPLHCLYVAPTVRLSGISTAAKERVRFINGFPMIAEVDALGEGEAAGHLFL